MLRFAQHDNYSLSQLNEVYLTFSKTAIAPVRRAKESASFIENLAATHPTDLASTAASDSLEKHQLLQPQSQVFRRESPQAAYCYPLCFSPQFAVRYQHRSPLDH